MIKAPKKLIECALPLDEINAAAAKEKSIRHGHPSTLHLWWARRPLAAARAMLFAQLVNDPGGERGWGKYPGQTKKDAQRERERLFDILRKLVKWENTNDEELLERAREEIRKSWRETCEMNKGKPGFDPDKLPAFHDPFAGGGAIPLEAQRLGMETYASDLNPVAVLINKAMIEIPPKFAGQAPVGPIPEGKRRDARGKHDWIGAKGLAEDILRYGAVLKKLAFKKIGKFYPEIELEKYDGGGKATVLAWLWARTVPSPNPAAAGVQVPLISSFWLCKKKGKETWVEPIIEDQSYRFEVRRGKPQNVDKINSGTKIARGANFYCLITGSPISAEYIKSEGKAGRMGWKLMAIVAEGDKGRKYVSPNHTHEQIALNVRPEWRPKLALSTHPQYMSVTNYGPKIVGDLFMPRQNLALNTFSELIDQLRLQILEDLYSSGWEDDGISLEDGGQSATAYADAISLYLGIGISRLANRQSTNTFWHTSGEKIEQVFSRQAIPFVWDTAEGNPFSSSSGNFIGQLNYMSKVISNSPINVKTGKTNQANAQHVDYNNKLISTDPPYFDNVPYSDLSDFFYAWLRHALRPLFPQLFASIATPKEEELVADYVRHGSKEKSEKFFIQGMSQVMEKIAIESSSAAPNTIFYAFRQAENDSSGTYYVGWETFLNSLINSGLSITGTWPVRTELTGNLKKKWNALASSIVLVCRKRDPNAPSIPRKQFLRELKEEMPEALETMTGGKEGATAIAPVDLAQAAIGPGMAIYSRYSGILEADGSKMSVRDALIQINRVIDEFFNEAEGDMDADTRFCIDWFMQYGFKADAFGQADVLARAKGTTVDGLAQAGVVEAKAGKVRLLKFDEYSDDWDPHKDQRTPTWEALHQLIRALRTGGESEAGRLLGKMTERTESIRQLAYRLFTLCERKGWAEEARAYNELIASWYGTMEAAASERKQPSRKQMTFDDL